MPSLPHRAPGGTFPLAGSPVSRIGYGAMQLAPIGGRPAPAREDALAVLRRAVELGVTHIDTADFYGASVANERIREALAPYPDELRIVTKVGAIHADGTLELAQRPEQLRAQVEANLRSLGVERLDVVNLRRADQGAGLIAEGEQIVDLDSQLAELVALRDEGKLAAIGLSNVSASQLRAASASGIACVQNAYNVLHRDDEEMLAVAAEHEIAWVPYFPLGSAFPQFPSVTGDPTVIAVAQRIGATPSQVGLAWLLQHAPNMLLIPGTRTIAHLEENVATADIALDGEATAALDALRD